MSGRQFALGCGLAAGLFLTASMPFAMLDGWTPTAAFANPGGSGNQGGNDGDNRGGGGPGTVGTTEVSPNRLTRMSPREFGEYADRVFNRRGENEPVTVIDGFSSSMSGWVLRGASARPRVFRGLLRDLKSVTDRDERLRILNDARRQLQAEIDGTRRGIERLEERARSATGDARATLRDGIGEERTRLRAAEVALESVNTWIEFPMEGTHN